jgi:hypothetical protein
MYVRHIGVVLNDKNWNQFNKKIYDRNYERGLSMVQFASNVNSYTRKKG